MQQYPLPQDLTQLIIFAKDEERFARLKIFLREQVNQQVATIRFATLDGVMNGMLPSRRQLVCVDTALLKQITARDFHELFLNCPLLLVIDPTKLAGEGKTELTAVKDKLEADGRIVMSNQELTRYFHPRELIMCEASGVYTILRFIDNKKMLVSRTLKKVSEQLMAHGGFFRVHQSYLVNLGHVRGLDKRDGCRVLLTNDLRAEVSRKRLGELKSAITAA